MAESDYVEPLTGEEIIIDLCEQIASKLRKDCNLREADSYQSGYSAKVTIHLEAYGMDVAPVDVEVVTGKARTPDPEQDQVIPFGWSYSVDSMMRPLTGQSLLRCASVGRIGVRFLYPDHHDL